MKEEKKIKQSQMRRKEKNKGAEEFQKQRIERWAVNFGGAIGPSLVYRVLPFTIFTHIIFKYRVLFSCRA